MRQLKILKAGKISVFFGNQEWNFCSTTRKERKKERKDVTMRKLCFVLIALLLTVPALAVVNVSCAQVGDDPFEVEVSYTSTGSLPRAFALDITVDAGTIIEVTDVNEKFWVYPGTIQINNGSIDDEGDPVAPNTDPCALGGEGTSGMTIEMGSLYSPNDVEHTTGPAASGTLLRFTVSDECTVTIEGNGARGKVVLENTLAADTNLPTTCVVEAADCLFNDGSAEYTLWSSIGKPDCWCYRKQCRGDINGTLFLAKPVTLADLNALKNAFNKLDAALPAGGTCANLDHAKFLNKHVTLADLNIMKTYFNLANASVPECDQVPVITGPYNFWTN
ncbi:MAG: hypothetical protein WC374_02300 [Phycisphaerae bacterium]|jgi:hypothetical protein